MVEVCTGRISKGIGLTLVRLYLLGFIYMLQTGSDSFIDDLFEICKILTIITLLI
jgi:hypothetical protein